MERRQQLRNVAFGGDWSEQIPIREDLRAALDTLEMAVLASADEDPCEGAILTAVDALCRGVAKGDRMARSWREASAIHDQGLRYAALDRVFKNIRSGVGLAAQG